MIRFQIISAWRATCEQTKEVKRWSCTLEILALLVLWDSLGRAGSPPPWRSITWTVSRGVARTVALTLCWKNREACVVCGVTQEDSWPFPSFLPWDRPGSLNEWKAGPPLSLVGKRTTPPREDSQCPTFQRQVRLLSRKQWRHPENTVSLWRLNRRRGNVCFEFQKATNRFLGKIYV